MVRIATMSLGLILVHSWYPEECCKDQDCYPANFVRKLENGDVVVRTMDDKTEIRVPADFPRHASEDGDYHICYDKAGWKIYHDMRLVCFFVPGEA